MKRFGVAHLLGLSPGKPQASDEEGEKKPEEEKGAGKPGDPDAEGGKGESKGDEPGGETEGEEGADASAALQAARAEGAAAERTRIASILGAEAARGRGDLALHLALETDMSAEQAVKALGASPLASKGQLDRLMQGLAPNPKLGPAGGLAPSADPWAGAVERLKARSGPLPAR